MNAVGILHPCAFLLTLSFSEYDQDRMRSIALIICSLLLISSLEAQQHTVGLLSIDHSRVSDGYLLLYPHNQPHAYLLNNCGEVVHIWRDSSHLVPGNTAYIMPDGQLVKTKRPGDITQDRIWAGGGGATVEIRDWDNNLEWSFSLNDSTARLHHDIEVLPNGNILMIAWEVKTMEEAIAVGRDSVLLLEGEVWSDMILEVDPDLDSIIWEWHLWDHLIQDRDSTKPNFGRPEDHPELLNINFARDGNANWTHFNSIDYNEELRQIILSSPFLNEIYIIDHSTSRDEAATGRGGLSGRGGDFMYRWGNPSAYNRGDSTNQLSFFQHDVHWLDDFLDRTNSHFGKLGIFNNEFSAGDFSTVSIWNPPWDMYTWSYSMQDGSWGPDKYDVNVTHPDSAKMYSSGLSSMQLLPNGNFLICVGRRGYHFEMTPEREIVWEYVTPLWVGTPVEQGDSLELNNNITFRIKKYPTEYAAFEGRDLAPKFFIELNPDSSFCTLTPVVEERESSLLIYPNPTHDFLFVDDASPGSTFEIVDLWGRVLLRDKFQNKRTKVALSTFHAGTYFLRTEGKYSKLIIGSAR